MKNTKKLVRTITLTDRAPVKIVDDEWSIIAGDSDHDGQVESQANHIWWIKVRQHADGRRIVYGRLGEGCGGAHIGWHGWAGGYLIRGIQDPRASTGVMMPDDDGTIDAIHQIAEGIEHPEMAARVIADLPAEAI